jgi:nicotinate-nucleotide pyrophosphorylase
LQKKGETRTLSEHLLGEEQGVPTCINIISKSKLYESTSGIIFHQNLLHYTEDGFDVLCSGFITFQWKLVNILVCEWKVVTFT